MSFIEKQDDGDIVFADSVDYSEINQLKQDLNTLQDEVNPIGTNMFVAPTNVEEVNEGAGFAWITLTQGTWIVYGRCGRTASRIKDETNNDFVCAGFNPVNVVVVNGAKTFALQNVSGGKVTIYADRVWYGIGAIRIK